VPDPDRLRPLLERRYAARLRRGLLAEGAVGVSAFNDPSFATARRSFIFGWSPEQDQAFYVHTMCRQIELAERPYYEREPEPGSPPRRALMASMLLPAIDRLHRQTALMETRFTMVRVALDLREHERLHGDYPTTWDMPRDSVSGDPLRYDRNDDGGFVLSTPREAEVEATWRWE
jgi:hypothetical protein